MSFNNNISLAGSANSTSINPDLRKDISRNSNIFTNEELAQIAKHNPNIGDLPKAYNHVAESFFGMVFGHNFQMWSYEKGYPELQDKTAFLA